MRKILSILVLFAASSSALAAVPNTYYITDSSGHDVISSTTSDPIELSIWYYGRTPLFDLKIAAVGSGTLNDPVITAVGRNSGNDSVRLIETNYWEISSAADSGTNLGTGVANPLAKIDFQSGSPGDVILNLYRYDSISGWVQLNTYSMTIHEIPEPITLVFLGLGGLMLRRRK
jgi:hypothetical protein